MDELRKTRGKRVAKSAPNALPAASIPLSQMAVSDDEIAAVDAFLGLQFAMIFGKEKDSEKPAPKRAANGG